MSIEGNDAIQRTGKVSFGGVIKTAYLAGLPQAKVGDYVLVHAGFAINIVDEAEAHEIQKFLSEAEKLEAGSAG